jgi:EAL domain-containing protein (putative c-di-GMP-specific phosphodiesterase class I)/GGDEF domain-containing protein
MRTATRLMFRHLRTKLTVLYAGLFAAALTLVSVAVYLGVTTNAERAVRGELAASGTVFDRVWALRARQLEDGASLLSRDFGFRAAFATHDQATVRSALDNLRERLGVDQALIVGVDGGVIAAGGPPQAGEASGLADALQNGDVTGGVFVMDGAPYQTIAAPILSPALMGWVVFAVKLDEHEMTSLAKLSAIPLEASVLHRGPSGGWSMGAARPDARVSAFIDQALATKGGVRELSGKGGDSVALVKPLPTIGGGAPAVLLLKFPLARALAPFQLLLGVVFATGIVAMALLILGSWALARSLTRPISALDDAARRLQKGETVQVSVNSNDEIARLADSFNSMAGEIRAREQRIIHLAHHDADTDLPNRLSLQQAIAELGAPSGGRVAVVAAFGVDRFSHVRGAIGYQMFSGLMRELGARVRGLKQVGAVGRLSTSVLGLAYLAADADEAIALAETFLDTLSTPINLGANAIDIHLSAGLALVGIDEGRVASPIERANVALDQARAGRRRLMVFDEVVYGDPAANLSLMSDMLRAVADGHMQPYYQPKYDIREGRITGLEALARWNHPIRGMLGPDLFIPMAEETGAIRDLTDCVLGRAIADQAALIAAGHDLAMSVNISGRLLSDVEFAGAALEMAKAAKGRLCFEITETAIIENPEAAIANIDRFAAAGIEISIDDYGAGLSSLAYLKRIPANELKIDKVFIMGMAQGKRDALLVRSTVDLAHSLGMKVTAEGVETPMVMSLLSGMGCDIAQGYLIARPMPLAALADFLAGDAGRSAADPPLEANA